MARSDDIHEKGKGKIEHKIGDCTVDNIIEPRRLIWRRCLYHNFTTTFICDDQPEVKVLITCSFHSFEEKEGMAYFKFLEALFPGISFVIVDIFPIAAPANIGYLGHKKQSSKNIGS